MVLCTAPIAVTNHPHNIEKDIKQKEEKIDKFFGIFKFKKITERLASFITRNIKFFLQSFEKKV